MNKFIDITIVIIADNREEKERELNIDKWMFLL